MALNVFLFVFFVFSPFLFLCFWLLNFLSSLWAPLCSLSSNGHGSFTGLSLSSSTTPRVETILLSFFCINHSKYYCIYCRIVYFFMFRSLKEKCLRGYWDIVERVTCNPFDNWIFKIRGTLKLACHCFASPLLMP